MSTLTSPVDIRADHLEIVQDILRTHLPAGFEVWVFGSRANWTTKDSSDLDLAVGGAASLDHEVMVGLEIAFEESNLPYTVDVVDLNAVSSEFRAIVESQKVPLFWSGSQLIGGDWCGVTLGDLVEIKHGYAFKGTNIHDFPEGSSDVLLTPVNFAVGGGFKAEKFKYYDGPVPDQFVLNKGDLVVTMTDLSKLSDTLGYPALVPECSEDHRYLHNQRLGKISLKGTGEVDTRYLYYVMCTTEYRDEVLASATGTTVKHTSPERIGRFTFKIPPLPEQRAIAHILGTLDDKIELNRRMNQTLEAMARAIFQDWFVDFGPVRAKIEGQDPYLPSELWDLFPDDLVDSELGEIPEGWEVGVLHDIVELLSGGTPRTSVPDYWDGNIPWYTPKDAPDPSDIFALSTERSITQAGVDNSSTKVLPTGTTIISARGTVGRLACLGVPMAMNQTCYGIRGACGYPDHFTYWNIKNSVNGLLTKTHGTIFDTITRETFQVAETILVPTQVALAFESTVNDLMGQIRWNLKESRCLAAQRDVLLPKLVSGELRLGDDPPSVR